MTAGHSHVQRRHGPIRPVLLVVVVVLAIVTLVGVVALRPTGVSTTRARQLGLRSERYRGVVTTVDTGPCSYAPDETCTTANVRIANGPRAGDATILGPFNDVDATSPRLTKGEKIVLGYEPTTNTYLYADRERRPALGVLTALFIVAVIVLGRRRGLYALIALAVTVVIILEFIVPSMLDGRSALLVAVVGAAAIAFIALYLTHGVNETTTVALLGTLSALALTTVLASVFFAVAHFTGLANEEAIYVQAAAGTIDIKGLLLGGAVLGALGALDDMTITQAAAVYELQAANPDIHHLRLYRSAMRIGRDHVGSTVNTLLLAYAGASMPLLLLFVLSGQSLGTVANSETVAVEIVRTLVGSIGLVAAVPITTALAVWTTVRSPSRAKSSAASTHAQWEDFTPEGHDF
ncbi:MAG: hypothetical protein QOD72_2963 [Acidimicrobiaceae bacterium]|nr:hypothetical protein [Acidimicrobiaceae bacterium]